eukprot:264877-Lingulodinium_polyedra.AAC.1
MTELYGRVEAVEHVTQTRLEELIAYREQEWSWYVSQPVPAYPTPTTAGCEEHIIHSDLEFVPSVETIY